MTEPLRLSSVLTVDGNAYDILWLALIEPLDAIAVLRCEITDRAAGPEPAPLVGKPVALTLQRAGDPQKRTFAGYVVEAESSTTLGDQEAEIGTRLVVRPRLFKLTQRTDCRTFQQLSAPDIVKEAPRDSASPTATKRGT